MTLEELYKLKDSLEELTADEETFSWGPSWEFANQRKEEALKIVKREIKRIKNEDRKYVQSQLGYSRIGRNNV